MGELDMAKGIPIQHSGATITLRKERDAKEMVEALRQWGNEAENTER
jgi:hypothetical protein